MDRNHGWYEGGHPFFGWVFALLLLVALAILVVVAVRWLLVERSWRADTAGGKLHDADDALATVQMRYARGEIDREEFLRLSADLAGTSEPVQDTGKEPPST